MTVVITGDLIRPTRGAMILSDLLTVADTALSVVSFVALAQIAAIWFSKGGHKGWTANPWSWAAVAVITLLAYQPLYLMGLGVTHLAEAKLQHRLRGLLAEAFSRLPLSKATQIPHGTVRETVCDDTAAIHTLVAYIPGDVTNALTGVTAGAIYLFWTDWRLALAPIDPWVPIIVMIAVTTMRGLDDITSRSGETQTGLTAMTAEMLEGVKGIRNFQAADATHARSSAARHRFSGLSYQWVNQSGKSISLFGTPLRPTTVFATVAVLAAVFTSQGWIELSTTLSFFLLAPGLLDDFNMSIGSAQYIYESRMAVQPTADLLSEEFMPQGTFDQDDGDAPGHIEVDDVAFLYEPDTLVLRRVSFTAEPGTVMTLVGPPGGDKSTLARFVAHFHDVDQGAVRISGVDMREAAFAWLLPWVVIVLQDVALTNDSVSDNIAPGRPGATREQVETAARITCVHDQIMCPPRGYDTILGEEGGFLSGGERQRVTLIRMYLQDAPTLVLNEATAQADLQSEHDVHQALARLAEGRTVIIIAHRLITIRDTGQILVLGNGQIVEQGRHDDLVAANGHYVTVWRDQGLALFAAAAREE